MRYLLVEADAQVLQLEKAVVVHNFAFPTANVTIDHVVNYLFEHFFDANRNIVPFLVLQKQFKFMVLQHLRH